MKVARIEKVAELKDVTLEVIEFVFFMAMQVGWASGKAVSHTTPLLPGYKVIPFDYGNFSVLDAYSIPHSGKSDGFTKIWFKEFPVWTMFYGGHYPKEVISFLKSALMVAYIKKIFRGGRGLCNYSNPAYPGLVYINDLKWAYPDTFHFKNFSGAEVIEDSEKGMVGSHWYHGMALI